MFLNDIRCVLDDCFALLEVLKRETSGKMRTAFARSCLRRKQSVRHDHLKSRGYRWSDGSDGRPKSWWIKVDEDALDNEFHFLRTEIYRWPDADPPIKRLTASN